ncbi:MAG TPA: hypothetical protein VGK73_04235 [Polyangiaceae bacterium]
MPDKIETATSARAKCRGCGRTIEKGVLRYGEADANPFGEGETFRWFHLDCAALRRPEKFGPALDQHADTDIPDRDALRAFVQSGLDHPRLVRLAGSGRAPSGRAHCRHCRELIEKGELRIALEIWEDGRFTPMGFLHARCGSGYFETRDFFERLRRVTAEFAEADAPTWAEEIAKESPPRKEMPPRDGAGSGEE